VVNFRFILRSNEIIVELGPPQPPQCLTICSEYATDVAAAQE
jgi:hypothetical protein